jgi:hypothetical protein
VVGLGNAGGGDSCSWTLTPPTPFERASDSRVIDHDFLPEALSEKIAKYSFEYSFFDAPPRYTSATQLPVPLADGRGGHCCFMC